MNCLLPLSQSYYLTWVKAERIIPDVLAQEIVKDFEAALEQFAAIVRDLKRKP